MTIHRCLQTSLNTLMLRDWVCASLTRRLRESLLMSSLHGTKGTFSVKHTVIGQKVVNAIWDMENSNQIESKGCFAALLFYWGFLFGFLSLVGLLIMRMVKQQVWACLQRLGLSSLMRTTSYGGIGVKNP